MNFANINTGEIRTALSTVLELQGRTITGATIEHYADLGWRKVVEVAQPATGFRVATYGVQEIDGLTCRLTITASVNIADEQAAAVAARLAGAKAEAKSILEGGTYELARAIRALAELTLQEINNLRTKTGLANYTKQQFLNAMKTKIDDQL